MKGHHITYTIAQLAWIKAHRKLPRRALHLLFVKKFRRRNLTVDALKQLCLRRGWKTGRTGCYPKGSVPANKGQKMPFNANSAATQFKKGGIPPNAKPVGHERIDTKDGYVWISIAETNPHTGFPRRYVMKHCYLWERANGPIPKGHVLKSLDGNKANTDPANWVPISRAMLLRLNGRWSTHYDTAPAELKPTIFAIAQLEQAARAKRMRKGKVQ